MLTVIDAVDLWSIPASELTIWVCVASPPAPRDPSTCIFELLKYIYSRALLSPISASAGLHHDVPLHCELKLIRVSWDGHKTLTSHRPAPIKIPKNIDSSLATSFSFLVHVSLISRHGMSSCY